jgi:hypothetical protein
MTVDRTTNLLSHHQDGASERSELQAQNLLEDGPSPADATPSGVRDPVAGSAAASSRRVHYPEVVDQGVLLLIPSGRQVKVSSKVASR